MKITLRIENHQPMPLEPLSHLHWGEGDLVYIGRPVMKARSEFEPDEDDETHVGWVLMDRPGKAAYPLVLETGLTFAHFDHYDFTRTLGRLARPGERLVVTYEVPG